MVKSVSISVSCSNLNNPRRKGTWYGMDSGICREKKRCKDDMKVKKRKCCSAAKSYKTRNSIVGDSSLGEGPAWSETRVEWGLLRLELEVTEHVIG